MNNQPNPNLNLPTFSDVTSNPRVAPPPGLPGAPAGLQHTQAPPRASDTFDGPWQTQVSVAPGMPQPIVDIGGTRR
jgi:hypothetical protein